MLVAVCDQVFGTSTSSCLKIVTPFSFPISAVRFSHSTSLNGEVLPSVKYRSNLKPLFVRALFIALAVSTVLPFNAGFTVAIQFPPRCRFPLSQRGTLLFYSPVPQGVTRHFRGRALQFQVSWMTLPGRNIKKRMRCSMPVFSTRPNSSPRALPNCAEHLLRARFFTVIPDWLRGSIAGPRHILDSGPSGASTSPESG